MARRKTPEADRLINIILMHGRASPVRRLSVWRGWIWTLAVLAVMLLGSLVWMAGTLLLFKNDMQRIETLKKENQAKTEQLKELQERVLRLENEKENIAKEQAEIKRLMGINSSAPSSRESPSRSGSGLTRQEMLDVSVTDEDQLEELGLYYDSVLAELAGLKDQVRRDPEYYQARPNTWPVSGRITSSFGVRKSPFSRRSELHVGVDIAADVGTPVRAAASGKVIFAGFDPVYGRLVKIDHGNGYVTWYAHNRANLVEVNEEVRKGQIIAKVGSSGRSSGPHLHFAIESENGFVDPETYLPGTER